MTTVTDDWMARGADETVLWSGQPRKTRALPPILVGVVVALLGVVFAVTGRGPGAVAFVAVGVGAVVAIVGYLRVVHTRFVVTDRALYRKTGIRSRSVQRLALRRVQNSTFRQGVAGSLFGYGTIHVEAAGGGSIQFEDVVDPESVRTLVERKTHSDAVPGSLAEWEAVLAEVRALHEALVARDAT